MPKSRRSMSWPGRPEWRGRLRSSSRWRRAQAAGFLSEIDDRTLAGGLDEAERGGEGIAGVGAGGMEDVAEQILRVHADEHGVGVLEGAFGGGVQVANAAVTEGQMNQRIAQRLVDAQVERPLRQADGQAVEAADEGVLAEAVFDEVGDGGQEETVVGAERFEGGEAGHGAVVGS